MKVLYIIDPGTTGGAAEAFLEIIRQMKGKGVECIVCVCSESSYSERLREAGCKTIVTGHTSVMEPLSPYRWKRPVKYPVRWLMYRYRREKALRILRKSVDMSTIDLIHTNSARNDLGCYLNKRYRIPHIVHFREFGDLDFECITLNKEYIHNFNHYSTIFVAISIAVMNHWVRKGLESKLFNVIYNGVHSTNIDISDIKEKDNKVLRMVIAGGICVAKGQLLVLEALDKIPSDIRSNLKVDLLGWNDPMYLKKIEEFSNKHDLKDNVTVVGPVNDVHQRLKNYQIGLTCSRSEGFGRVTAEYMHAQLGVIASDSGANPELIENGVTGLLFKSGDSDSLAKQIMKFYNDRELLKSCSIEAKEKAVNNYTDDINSNQLYQLYQKLLSK